MMMTMSVIDFCLRKDYAFDLMNTVIEIEGRSCTDKRFEVLKDGLCCCHHRYFTIIDLDIERSSSLVCTSNVLKSLRDREYFGLFESFPFVRFCEVVCCFCAEDRSLSFVPKILRRHRLNKKFVSRLVTISQYNVMSELCRPDLERYQVYRSFC